MNQDQMIADLIAKLDGGVANGVGHINVDVDETMEQTVKSETGCTDISKAKFPGMAPTLLDEDDIRNNRPVMKQEKKPKFKI